MTVEEIIYDILEIKQAVNDDSDLDELFLLQKINSYRALFIQDAFTNFPIVNPEWVQRTGVISVEKINSADDPNISVSSIILGKAQLPPLISLPEDTGLYRVSGSSGILSFDFVSFPQLMMKIWAEDDRDSNYGFTSRIGNSLYIYPYTSEIQALAIGENPMDFQVLENNTWRDRTFSDDYPIGADLAQKIILEIVTKDLNIKDQMIADVINDSQVELKLMKNRENK